MDTNDLLPAPRGHPATAGPETADSTADQLSTGRRSAWLRRYGTYRGITVDIVLALVLQVVLAIAYILIAGAVYAAAGRGVQSGLNWAQTAPASVPIELLLTDGGLLLLLWFRLARSRVGWSLFGLSRDQLGRRPGRAVAIGVVIGLVCVTIDAVVSPLLAQLGLDQSSQFKEIIAPMEHAPVWVALTTIFLGTFVAPPIEEIFFRGYLFRALARRKSLVEACLVSSAVFAAFHFLPTLFPVLFLAGVLFSIGYQRTGNMLTNMAAHATNNGVAFAVSLLPILLHK
jgi:membrane protease YdiL (CAAX protease family)